VEAKTVAAIGDSELGQMLTYLKVTGHQLGMIFNFRHPKLEWERVVR
jgi:GxxExxY protein